MPRQCRAFHPHRKLAHARKRRELLDVRCERFGRAMAGETLLLRERVGQVVWFVSLFPVQASDGEARAGGIAVPSTEVGDRKIELCALQGIPVLQRRRITQRFEPRRALGEAAPVGVLCAALFQRVPRGIGGCRQSLKQGVRAIDPMKSPQLRPCGVCTP